MPHQPLTILIADDDIEDMELLEDALVAIEPGVKLHKLLSAKSVMEHLNQLTDDMLPCLFILDYNMPELNGSELLSLISSQPRYRSIPKIILSTSSAPLHIHECMRNGATEYFVKPDNVKDLDILARKMLAFCKPVE